MQPRVALVAAIACAVAATGLVAADLAFNVDAKLEVKDDSGAWREVATNSGSPRDYYSIPAPADCGQEFRLTVHNGLPWSSSQKVVIYVSGNSAAHSSTILDETWTVGAGQEKSFEFRVPDAAVQPAPNQPDGFPKGTASVQVTFGDSYDKQLYATACQEASA